MSLRDKIEILTKKAIKESFPQVGGVDFLEFFIPDPKQTWHYSTDIAFRLSKQIGEKSIELAKKLAIQIKDLDTDKILAVIQVAEPGFINFYFTEKTLQESLKDILKEKEKFGSSKIGKNKKIIIDYSSPNVAKNMHAGHLRSTIIGDSLARIFEFLGYKVISDNHVGDWGTQYGILLYQYKNKFGTEIKEGLTIDELEEMYVEFMAQEKEDESLREKAKAELKKLQDGDKENLKLWKYFYSISKKEFNNIYSKLKIRPFDLWNGESFYNKQLSGIVEKALKNKIAEKSEGATIIDLEKFNLPPVLIQKTDEAFLYATSDLATIDFRHKKYKPVEILYVVANQQALHFDQVFNAAKLLGLYDKEKLTHIKFGLLLGENGKKMSTREGGVIKLTDLINEIISKAREVVEKKNPNLSEQEKNEIAEKVGIGALKYNDLSQNRLSDIVFDWQKMLSFESGSAPYLQYTYVRIKSILNKQTDIKPEIKNLNLLKEHKEIGLMLHLMRFEKAVVVAAETYRPNLIAEYLDKLASEFHSFYEVVPVLKTEEKLCSARLALISAVSQTIKNGLSLLGIETPEKM